MNTRVKSLAKPELILAKAEKLIALKGFTATSIREIAKEAGVNIAMISYYFGSKEKLLENLLQTRMEEKQEYVKQIISDPKINEWQKFEKIIDGYVENVKNNQDFFHIMVSLQLTTKNKRILSFIRNFRFVYLNLFESLIVAGNRNKIFTKHPDVVMLQATLTGTIFFALKSKALYKLYKKNYQPEQEYDEVYFSDIKKNLKSIMKALVGYEAQ
ncbi:MAG: TetR/AcrR family transcriptional regulator [Chitinophagaceae bacterium]|jgi:AcrR family transcriptional regulator|nr:TetR/AcrR family transcriptional regulator [Chitinophagaceae bacterium]MBP6046368.1 TetR/AcrR family transcriptional regulator [Ferruginibacter sp.]MBK7089582.1 TetR/AcrR family transcriptional regulator [Chitinophagaceae bacterium]MBK7347310.1 TetR/AcrR family transcriptional regulator [Chitinophagaceae bacterium]MBK7733968.1 TetR/AcrR family transcriptional regulator [Chitinophagaceae bacterium]